MAVGGVFSDEACFSARCSPVAFSVPSSGLGLGPVARDGVACSFAA